MYRKNGYHDDLNKNILLCAMSEDPLQGGKDSCQVSSRNAMFVLPLILLQLSNYHLMTTLRLLKKVLSDSCHNF